MRAQDLLRRTGGRVVQVRPGTDLLSAMTVMSAEEVGTVLVMEDNGDLKGLISERDFVPIFTEHGARALEFAVCDLVRRPVVTCHEDATLHDLMTLMSNNRIRHLPVMRDGRIIGMVSARDVLAAQKEVLLRLVNRRKQAYQLALQAKEQAEESDRQKTEFLHRVTHELRTPLNAIIGFGELIESQPFGPVGDERYGDYATEIRTSGRKLLGIIDEILEMTRLALGEWEAASEVVDLEVEIRATLAEYEDWACGKGLSVTSEISTSGLSLVADRFMVREMVGHLLGNAVKFTPAGGAIEIRADEDTNEDIRIRISDTGRGIPVDRLETVTKPFSCTQDALAQKDEGIGLGLALTDAMISVMGGSLGIESTVGEGTVVTLIFPAARRHEAGASIRDPIPKAATLTG